MSWTQAICEWDWIGQRGKWEVLPDESGDFEQLVSVELPIRVMEPRVERCSWCGQPTIFGVYLRADPASVPYPRNDDDA